MADEPLVKSWTNAVAGLLTILVCLFFLIGAVSYGIGSIARMGPGFFPASLGAIGLVLGLTILVNAMREPFRTSTQVRFRPFTFILVSVLLFALVVDSSGLIPAIALAGFVSALGDSRTRIWEALALAVFLSGGVYLVFLQLLALPIPAIAFG
ncbi:MAG: tripartite tricarboxylate transporter TctB family protein [Azospirillaceae bacterium]